MSTGSETGRVRSLLYRIEGGPLRLLCAIGMASLLFAACGGSSGSTPTTATSVPATTTSLVSAPPTTEAVPQTTVVTSPPTTAKPAPPTTSTSSVPTITGFGATLQAFRSAHGPQDANYEGLPAFGPVVQTPGGPTPQFIDEGSGSPVDLVIESVPDGTSLAGAKADALELLPADTISRSFVIATTQGGANNGQTCAFWNLSSSTLDAAGISNSGTVTVETAYDNSDGAPSWQPSNVNTLTFEPGVSTPTSTC
jgi:hypothetical protein